MPSDASCEYIEISTLHETLEKYWPSLSCGSSSTCHGGKGSLLEHEDLILCSLSFLFNLSLYTIQTNFYSFLCSCLLGMAEMGDIQCQWGNYLQPLLTHMIYWKSIVHFLPLSLLSFFFFEAV
ncbi:hypothetical protein ACB092_12G190000 [Castanea dentata]